VIFLADHPAFLGDDYSVYRENIFMPLA